MNLIKTKKIINDKFCGWTNALQSRENFKVLNKNFKCDYLIIGAGYTGLSAARKLGQLYPNLAISKFWDTANRSMASLFHLFNLTCAKDSTYSTFDANDYKQVLDSGILVYGASPVKDWDDPVAVSRAIRENLKGNLLTGGIDISTGTCAGAIVIGGNEQLDNIRQSALDDAFSQLSRMLRPNSLVHRGIYSGDKPNLTIFTKTEVNQ